MKKMREVCGKDDNGHLREKMNSLLMGQKIKKRMQKAYNQDSNGLLKEEINPFTNKK